MKKNRKSTLCFILPAVLLLAQAAPAQEGALPSLDEIDESGQAPGPEEKGDKEEDVSAADAEEEEQQAAETETGEAGDDAEKQTKPGYEDRQADTANKAGKDEDPLTGFTLDLNAGIAIPLKTEAGACSTFPVAPLAGAGAWYRVTSYFEAGLKVAYRYFRTECNYTGGSTGESSSSLPPEITGYYSEYSGDEESTSEQTSGSNIILENHILLAGPAIRFGYTSGIFRIAAFAAGGWGFVTDEDETIAEAWVEGGAEMTLELMQDPVPVTGGLGASYLHPFPENWEEKDVEGWINLYLMVSILF